MCGIAGVFGPGPVAAGRDSVAGMLRALRHRGPDGEGTLERTWGDSALVLGHRRLAIIDLSAAAAQPMSSADGNLHVVLNGEIYNHVELRQELEREGCRFRTRSDTEVLLEAWAIWGRSALDRVVGMFAFAVFDEQRRVLILARDQFAMKPLYYAVAGRQLAFASEIPPLLAVPGVGRAADPGPLADFVARAVNNHPGRTLFADVREIPGAHLAEVSLDEPRTVVPQRYWRPPVSQTHDLGLPEAAARVREMLEESVRLHLRSDVPVGLMLSGGQDSSALVALTRKVLGADAEIHTFSYRGGGEAFDEGPYIDATRSATRAIGHDVLLTPRDWAATLPSLVAAQGEPFGSPVIHVQRRLFGEAASQGIRVVLDGQGSDEYLAGYEKFLPARLASLLHAGSVGKFVRGARGYAEGGAPWSALLRGAIRLRWPSVVRLRGDASYQLLDAAWLRHSRAAVSELPSPPGPDVLRSMLSAGLSTPSLPWLMRYADRNAMAFSVENRLPFLNPRLIEFVLGLPEEHFITTDGVGKQLLRRAMQGLVPDQVLRRRAHVGFDVPLGDWLRHTPNVPQLVQAAMSIPAVNLSHGKRLLETLLSGRPMARSRAFEVWRLVTLSTWAETFNVSFS